MGAGVTSPKNDIELRARDRGSGGAEDPRGDWPTGGRAGEEPAGPGVRVDSSLLGGTVVGRITPLLTKVIAHGADREEALIDN